MEEKEELDAIEQRIKQIKKIPAEVKAIINKKVYENIFIALIIMAVCNMLLLGYKNIEPTRFLMDLKIFSITALLSTLLLIEFAYKKDSGKLAINSVEAIIISLFMLFIIYIYTYYIYAFPLIVLFAALVLGLYYSIKGIIIIFKEKNKYKKSSNDISDIIK